MVYRVDAAHNEFDHIIADHRKAQDFEIPGGLAAGTQPVEEWTPPNLIYCRGKKKIRPNLMDYDQGLAFAADDEAIDKLALREADWCRVVLVKAEALDRRYKPIGQIEFALIAVTRHIDAVDRSRTTFKPYGDQVFLDDQPDQTHFRREKLPTDGLFHHKSGASTCILTYDDEARPEQSFRRLFESSGLTGLKFIPFGKA